MNREQIESMKPLDQGAPLLEASLNYTKEALRLRHEGVLDANEVGHALDQLKRASDELLHATKENFRERLTTFLDLCEDPAKWILDNKNT